MKASPACALIVVAAAGCSTVNEQISDLIFIPNPNSAKLNNAVELEIAYSQSVPCTAPEKVKEAADHPGRRGKSEELTSCPKDRTRETLEKEREEGQAALLGGSALSLAKEELLPRVKKALADEAARYTQTYQATAGGSRFYHYSYPTGDYMPFYESKSADEGYYRPHSDIKFAGFILERVLEPKSRKGGGENGPKAGETAMRICAIALPTDNDAFIAIIPVSYEFTYAKAKLLGFSLLSPFGADVLNPWEIVTDPLFGDGLDLPPSDRNVNVTMKAKFSFLQRGTNGEVKEKETSEQVFETSAARISGKPIGGYFPAYRRFKEANLHGLDWSLDCSQDTTTEQLAELRDRIMHDVAIDHSERLRLESAARLFQAAPRAIVSRETGTYGNANFTLTVHVTEVDDYGKRVAEGADFEEAKGVVDKVSGWVDPK